MSGPHERVWLVSPTGLYLGDTQTPPPITVQLQSSPCEYNKIYNSDGTVSYTTLQGLQGYYLGEAFTEGLDKNDRSLALFSSEKGSHTKWKDDFTLTNGRNDKFVFAPYDGYEKMAFKVIKKIAKDGISNNKDRNHVNVVQKTEQMLMDEIRTVIGSFTGKTVMDYPYEEAKKILDSLRSLVERSKPLLARKVLIKSVAHGTYLNPRGDKVFNSIDPSFWIVIDNPDGTVLLQPWGTDVHLSGSPERDVTLHKNSFDWEKWIIEGNNIKSFKHGTYLSAAPDGSVNLQPGQHDWEEIVLLPDANAGAIKYAYDKAAGALRQFETRCKQNDEARDIGMISMRRQQGIPIAPKVSPDNTLKTEVSRVASIKTSSGTYLYPREDDIVDQRNTEYFWVVILNEDGTVHFQATDQTKKMMSADEDGTVSMKATNWEYEKWTFNEFQNIKSFHNTFLSASPHSITHKSKLSVRGGFGNFTTYENYEKFRVDIKSPILDSDTVVSIETSIGSFISYNDSQEIIHTPNKCLWVMINNDDGTLTFQAMSGESKLNKYIATKDGTEMTLSDLESSFTKWRHFDLKYLKSNSNTYMSIESKSNRIYAMENAGMFADKTWEKRVMNIKLEQEGITQYENFDKFRVMNDGYGNTLIQFSNKLYKHLKPQSEGVINMLPNQSLGTCYFFAAMNMLLNESEFILPFTKHLASLIKKNKYSRQVGESAKQANERRFGKEVDVDLTLQSRFNPSKDKMNKALDSFEGNRELYEWARNVMLYHMITSSFQYSGKEYDSQAAVLMQDWSDMHKGGKKYEKAVKDVGYGGNPLKALYNILRLSGLDMVCTEEFRFNNNDVSGRETHGGIVARIPGSDIALCVGSRDYVRSETELPNDGSCTGMYSQLFNGLGLVPGLHWVTGTGHAMAYLRHNDTVKILDSNHTGTTSTIGEAIKRYKLQIGKPTYFIFYPAYTCKIPSSDFKTIGVQKGGGDDDIELIRNQSLLLMPEQAESVMTCTDEVCTIDDELKAALMVVSSFVEEDIEPQQGGGGYAYCWAALSAVIMSMAMLQN